MFDHHIKQSMDRPSKVANPARGQLNRENEYFPVRVRASEFDLARRVRPSRPASSCPLSTLRLNLVLLAEGFLPIFAVASIYLFIPPYPIGSVPNLSGHAIACRWRSLPRVHRYRASSPQGSCSNGCCHFAGHHGPINVRLYFPTPTIGMK